MKNFLKMPVTSVGFDRALGAVAGSVSLIIATVNLAAGFWQLGAIFLTHAVVSFIHVCRGRHPHPDRKSVV